MLGLAEDVAAPDLPLTGFEAEGVEGLDHPAVGVFDGNGMGSGVSELRGGEPEPEFRVVVPVAEHEGEFGALLPQCVEPCLDELSADALALVCRDDGEGGEDVHQGRFLLAVEAGAGEEDVPDGLVAAQGEKGYAGRGGGVGKEVGGEPGFFVVPEALLLYLEDDSVVVGCGFADMDIGCFHFVSVVDGAAALRA